MNPVDQAPRGPMTHVVMWRLLETAMGRTAQENAILLKAGLEAMRGLIPGMTSLDVGIDTRRRANSFDVVLICGFESAEALEAYHDHPAHEGRNPFHPLGRAVVPRDRCRRDRPVLNGRVSQDEKRRFREGPRGVGTEGILGHDIAGHSVGAGAAAAAVAVQLARPASAAERRPQADAGEQFG